MGASRGPGVRGRPFAPGNPGRKPGSKNKTTLLSVALLEGEQPELLHTALDIAKRGNFAMLKFFLARWVPRDRLITIDLPSIDSLDDALEALRRILCAVSAGVITPAEGAALGALISPFVDRNAAKPATRERTPTLSDHLRSLERE